MEWLDPHLVIVYRGSQDDVDDLLTRRLLTLLTAEEHARRLRFLFEKNRHEYLVGRAGMRCVLSRHFGVAPAEWRFEPNEHGRPMVATPELFRGVQANVSHTEGQVAVVVSKAAAAGVDVEYTGRPGQTVAIADRFFSRAEVAALNALPEAERTGRFFDYWTLKESYIKARGMGLAIPLGKFSFDVASPIRIALDQSLGDDAARWRFELRDETPTHKLAVAAAAADPARLKFEYRPLLPLLEAEAPGS